MSPNCNVLPGRIRVTLSAPQTCERRVVTSRRAHISPSQYDSGQGGAYEKIRGARGTPHTKKSDGSTPMRKIPGQGGLCEKYATENPYWKNTQARTPLRKIRNKKPAGREGYSTDGRGYVGMQDTMRRGD